MADEASPTEIVLEHLKVLRIEPGDTLVLSAPGPISMTVAEQLREAMADHFGADTKVMVLSDGLQMGVVRRAPAPED